MNVTQVSRRRRHRHFPIDRADEEGAALSKRVLPFLADIHGALGGIGPEKLKDVRLLTGDDIRSMFPQLRADDIIGGSFCSTDGFVDPYSAMIGLMTWAADHGAKLWKNALVTGISRNGESITGVETTRGTVSTRRVVNCAGAWAAPVANMAGVDLPVQPLRRMLVPTEPFDQFPHSAPMIIDMSNGFHFRPEGLGFLLAWNDPEETPGYKMDFEPAFIEKILTQPTVYPALKMSQ